MWFLPILREYVDLDKDEEIGRYLESTDLNKALMGK